MTTFCAGRGSLIRPKTAVYAPNGVVFDGTNDYLSVAALNGSADSPAITIAFALRLNAIGAIQNIFRMNATTARILVRMESTNELRIQLKNSVATVIADWKSSGALTTGQWYAVLASRDNSGYDLWIGDTDVTTTIVVNATGDIDFTNSAIGVGADSAGASKLNGELADLFMLQGTRVDFSTEANRRKFFSAAGCLVDKGSDGTTPGFGTPILFLGDDNDETNWETNNGSGGNFTENGALTSSAADPCGV